MAEKSLLIINRSCKKISIHGTGERKSLTKDNQTSIVQEIFVGALLVSTSALNRTEPVTYTEGQF